MNVAYKHLDSKLRIADLTLGQWISILIGVGLGATWALYLSPFVDYVTLVLAIYLGAFPVAAAVIATMTDLDVWLLARSVVRWRRVDGRFGSGPGDSARGYVVREDAEGQAGAERRAGEPELDLAALWDGS